MNVLFPRIAARLRYPVTDLTEHVPPFIGLPEDTYFTDVGINFTNYRKDAGHHDDMKARVIEILGLGLSCGQGKEKRPPNWVA